MSSDLGVKQAVKQGDNNMQIGVLNNYGLSVAQASQLAFEIFKQYYPRLKDELLTELKEMVVAEISKIKSENLIQPKARIVVPLLQNASFTEEKEIRELYAKLLASSMNKDKQEQVHPAFIEIINQLSSDEAKLLKVLPLRTNMYHPILEVRIKDKNTSGYVVLISNYTDIADDVCEHPEDIESYIDNLERLKIIRIDKIARVNNTENYEKLKNTELIRTLSQIENLSSSKLDYGYGLFNLTHFGFNFLDICVKG